MVKIGFEFETHIPNTKKQDELYELKEVVNLKSDCTLNTSKGGVEIESKVFHKESTFRKGLINVAQKIEELEGEYLSPAAIHIHTSYLTHPESYIMCCHSLKRFWINLVQKNKNRLQINLINHDGVKYKIDNTPQTLIYKAIKGKHEWAGRDWRIFSQTLNLPTYRGGILRLKNPLDGLEKQYWEGKCPTIELRPLPGRFDKEYILSLLELYHRILETSQNKTPYELRSRSMDDRTIIKTRDLREGLLK